MRILIFLFTSIIFFSCTTETKKDNLGTNREVVKRFHLVWSNNKIDQLNELITPDFVCHFLAGYEWKGIDGTAREIIDQHKAFPDWHEEIVDMIAENNKVVTRYKSTGTHQGTTNGIDSTGNKISIYETSIYRLTDGKIVEQWCFADKIALLQQLQSKK